MSTLFPAIEPLTTVDPNGNIMLIVASGSTNARRFQVCSHILCLVSPVFRAMLGANSRFKEATELAASARNKDSAPVEVKLEDDDPDAIALLLWAIHHKSDKVPRKLTFQQLFTLAVVIDKYDCREALGMWLEAFWLPEWKLLDNSPTAKPETEWPKWLFMSYVFGEREIFEHVSKRLILEGKMRSAESDDFVVEGSIEWQAGVPQNILSEIFRAKKRTVTLCVEAVNAYGKGLQRTGNPRCKAAGVDEVERQICDSVIYGQLIHEYVRLGLWLCGPINNTFETSSVNKVQSDMKDISIKYFKGDDCERCCINPYLHYTSMSNCKNCQRRYHPSCSGWAAIKHRDTCDFTGSLKTTIDSLVNTVVGLRYDIWVKKKDDKMVNSLSQLLVLGKLRKEGKGNV